MNINALIVDDEAFSVDTLIQNIDWPSYGIDKVYSAYSAAEARNLLLREDITIALCDIEMPGESGLELIEWVQEGTRLKGMIMEFVILTCHPEYEFMRKALQIGCSDYLLKPIDYEELDRVLKKTVKLVQNKLAESSTHDLVEEILEDEDRHDIVREKIIPYIHDHLTESFNVTDLADEVALNHQYMMRLFKKNTGYSIIEYVTQQKIQLAKEILIKTEWNNELVAEKVGYISASYFIKAFKRQVGMTPKEYRKQMKRL